jgi:hypothetical protein
MIAGGKQTRKELAADTYISSLSALIATRVKRRDPELRGFLSEKAFDK